MTRETDLDRRSVGVRYWRWRDVPFIALGLLVARVAHAIDVIRGDDDGE